MVVVYKCTVGGRWGGGPVLAVGVVDKVGKITVGMTKEIKNIFKKSVER